MKRTIALEIPNNAVEPGNGVEAHIFRCMRCTEARIGVGHYEMARAQVKWVHLSIGDTSGWVCETCESAMRDALLAGGASCLVDKQEKP